MPSMLQNHVRSKLYYGFSIVEGSLYGKTVNQKEEVETFSR